MENSEAVTIEGENYEVVDECIEEEDVSNAMQNKPAESSVDTVGQVMKVDLSNADVSCENIKDDGKVENVHSKNESLNDLNSCNNNKENASNIVENENVQQSKTDTNLNSTNNNEENASNIVENKNFQEPITDTNLNSSNNNQENAPNIIENKDLQQPTTDTNNLNSSISNNNDENASNIVENKDLQQSTTDTNDSNSTNIKENASKIVESKDLQQPTTDTNNLNSSISNNNDENASDIVENKDLQQSTKDTIDFTADISLDQLDEKDMTDEDVLQHLNEIENIVLNSTDFPIKDENNQSAKNTINPISETKESTQNNENNETDNDIKPDEGKTLKVKSDVVSETEQLESNCTKNAWYEKKLTEKETIIKERLSKVARVLGISYPCYEKWLEWEEKTNGNSLCKLKPTRRCRLDKPYTNRWKFICSRKRVQEFRKMDDAHPSLSKNTETFWKLEASGAWGVNIKNESEFPPFVLRAVKIFEEFLRTTEPQTTQEPSVENFSDDISMEMEPKKENIEAKQEWLWLVVRCNSMDELMLFATGKNISRSTMDRLKQVYESGPGKDCNVKSLYCKSTNKYDDTTVTDTTFLVGSEALDETVGGLKVQLAPKTNFWSNAAGAENVAKAVMDFLAPTPKSTVLEIGCGIGLIGLMMASKCQQVIGVDSPSEVEEAEMTCELNNIKNASFIMGSPTEVTSKIVTAIKNRKTCAVINANTNIGRAIEVMTCLRKIVSLKRIVMITTLTKQSVRAILELARPVDHGHGSPFIPVLACVVDTLPVGPHFEAVILLQRRIINKSNQPWFQKSVEENKTPENTTQEKVGEQKANGSDKKTTTKVTQLQTKKPLTKPLIKPPTKKSKIFKKPFQTVNTENSSVKSKFRGKRSHSPDKSEALPKKLIKSFSKGVPKPWNTDLSTKKKNEWTTENPQLRINPFHEKKMREHKEQADLRERLSNNRFDTDIAQKVKEHQALLEIAKEKLSGPAPTIDVNTAKQLQSMLNMVLEQTNKLQSQLPRSVWERIAPPDNTNSDQRENKQDDPLLKGRYVQEMGSQDILITTANKQFLNNDESVTKPIYKKYHNLPPLEPNTIMPVSEAEDLRGGGRPYRTTSEQYHETEKRHQQDQEDSWNLDKLFERNRWNEMSNIRKPVSPMRRQVSPMKHRITPPKRFSPKRPLLSPPRRPCSPPRRHYSPARRPVSPFHRPRSPLRCQISPLRRPSPPRRPVSPRRPASPPRRTEITLNRPMSPFKRQMSPPRRQMSPMRLSPIRRQMSPPRRQIPSPNRMMSPNRQEMLLSRLQTIPQERQQISPGRRAESPQRPFFMRPTSTARRQSPQRRQMSPQQKYTDEWDIPSRGAIEQNNWSRSMERMPEQNVWRNEKSSTSNNNWEQTSCNDKRRKTFNQDSGRENTWSNSGNNWNSKQLCTSGPSNRWLNTTSMTGSNDNWNIRGKESFMLHKDTWTENKKPIRWETLNAKDLWKQPEKEDLNDLPEDARDPWGDDGNLDSKERWHKYENTSASSSTWARANEQRGDTWSKPKDNWQNEGSSFGTKPQWKNNDIQESGESRWMPHSNIKKDPLSNSWQSGNNMGSWQSQSSNYQPRSFSNTQFKDLY